jgi:hypothetical protein
MGFGCGGAEKMSSNIRHAELGSASMARARILRRAEGNGKPWVLKQVQDDED